MAGPQTSSPALSISRQAVALAVCRRREGLTGTA